MIHGTFKIFPEIARPIGQSHRWAFVFHDVVRHHSINILGQYGHFVNILLQYLRIDVALAHAGIAVGDLLAVEARGEHLGDDEPRDDRVDAVRHRLHQHRRHRLIDAVLVREALDERLEAARLHLHIVDGLLVQRIVERRRALERAADARDRRLADVREGRGRSERRLRLLAHRLALRLRRQHAVHVLRAEGQRANRQADLLLDLARSVGDDLRARAADIDEQARVLAEVVRRADEVVRRLLVARDHADRQPRAPLDLTDRRRAVLRIAQRRRRERHDMRDVEGEQEGPELLENLYRLIDALLLHDAVPKIRRQPDRVLLLHEHLDMRAFDAINRHADRVRSNINHSV